MQVKDVMTSSVLTVGVDAPLHEVAAALAARRISGLPVVDAGGALLGVISEADIIAKEAPDPSGARTAGEAMSSPARTIEPQRSVAEAARVMLAEGVKRLPVVSDGELVGIVTRADLVRAFVRPDEELRQEIRESVALRWHGIDPNGLTVRVKNGEVEVEGHLASEGDAELVEQVIQQILGVVSVECRAIPALESVSRG
jgi:CBS domain-containing protein